MKRSAAPSQLARPRSIVIQSMSVQKDKVCIPAKTAPLVHDPSNRCFEAVYAKKSTRKMTPTKSSRLKLGAFDVELLTLIANDPVSVKKPCVDAAPSANDNQIQESDTTSHINQLPMPIMKPIPKSIRSCFDQDKLIMPRPSQQAIDLSCRFKFSHSYHSKSQWADNPSGLPIVDVTLNGRLASRLHPHQREGITFLYECLMGYRRRHHDGRSTASDLFTIPSDQSFGWHDEDVDEVQTKSTDHQGSRGSIYGCILADEMGLGKTVQTIATIWLLLKQGPYGGRAVIQRCLIVTPSSLIQNWSNEISKWLGRENLPSFCVTQTASIREYAMKPVQPPVLIMSYEMLVQHREEIALIPGLDLIVCDEGHRLKNSNIMTYTSLCSLPARRRLILTGTPLQNNLDELWSLGEFCAPGQLGSSRDQFRRLFSSCDNAKIKQSKPSIDDPLDDSDWSNQQHGDLASLLNSFLLRRTADVIAHKLVLKTEHIVFCQPTNLQRRLESCLATWVEGVLQDAKPIQEDEYDGFPTSSDEDSNHDTDSPSKSSNCNNTASILCAITALRKLANHPLLLARFLQQPSTPSKTSLSLKSRRTHMSQTLTNSLLSILNSNQLTDTGSSSSTTPSSRVSEQSGKLRVLSNMLGALFSDQSKRPSICHRLVLVSNFTQTLDLLETVCAQFVDQRRCCLRLDGSTPGKQRQQIVQNFNDPKSSYYILLLSSRAGGTGLNLTGADHLILFDMDWNPANDSQAMARIWRVGQKRPVHLYRLVSAGGVEERIFQRQIAKSNLASACLASAATSTKVKLSKDELRDLFQLPSQPTACWTHDLLKCNCNDDDQSLSAAGNLAPESNESQNQQVSVEQEDDEERCFQLGRCLDRPVSSKVADVSHPVKKSISDNLASLLEWKHSLDCVAIAQLDDVLLCSPTISAVFTTTSSSQSFHQSTE